MIAGLVLSCSNDDVIEDKSASVDNPMALTGDELNSLNPGQGQELSESEIIDIVTSFQNQLLENSISYTNEIQTKSLKSKTLTIKDKYYLGEKSSTKSTSSSNISAPVYEVEISNANGTKGLALVSGDDRFPQIISYIPISEAAEDSHLKSEVKVKSRNIGADQMLGLSKETYKIQLEDIVAQQSKKDATLEKIAKGLGINASQVDNNTIEKYVRLYGTNTSLDKYLKDENSTKSAPSDIDIRKAAISRGLPCGTLWHQSEPFNYKYDKDYVDILFGMVDYTYPPAGCAVVAMAQIVAALAPSTMKCYGMQMDWTYLKASKEIWRYDETRKIDMVSLLYKDIYVKSKSEPQWGKGQYGWPPVEVDCIVQNGTTSSNVENYFNSASGVTVLNNGKKMVQWDPELIRQSLFYSFPVFVGGKGHAFVLDEFICMPIGVTRQLIKQYDVYFHANFGWQGSGTGYYLVKDRVNGSITFETQGEGGDFKDTDLSVLTHIGKKNL